MNSFQQCANFQSWVERAHLFQCDSFLNKMTKECWNEILMDPLIFCRSNHQGTFLPHNVTQSFSPLSLLLLFIYLFMISDVWSCGPMGSFLCLTWMMDMNMLSQTQLNSFGSPVPNLKRRVVLSKRFHGLTMVIGVCRLDWSYYFVHNRFTIDASFRG